MLSKNLIYFEGRPARNLAELSLSLWYEACSQNFYDTGIDNDDVSLPSKINIQLQVYGQDIALWSWMLGRFRVPFR